MRRNILLLSTATLLCCGFSSMVSAQFSLSATPTLAPQLYLAQNSNSDDQATAELADSANAKPSPFDLFSEDSANSTADSAADISPNDPSADSTEPTSEMPVAQNMNSAMNSASPADTIISGSQALAYNNFAPMSWPGARGAAPNHTANYMLIQWCVDGLWDNYPAERAAECARQAKRIAGRQNCGTAGSCRQAGCYQQSPTCGNAGKCGVFKHFLPSKVLDQQQTTSCDSAQAAKSSSTQYVQASFSPNGRPMPADLPPPQNETGKVAFKPLSLNR